MFLLVNNLHHYKLLTQRVSTLAFFHILLIYFLSNIFQGVNLTYFWLSNDFGFSFGYCHFLCVSDKYFIYLKGAHRYSKKMSELDQWVEIVKDCKYLPEDDLRELCGIVSDLLLEESNIHPVQSPVTVCGDIHGQFYDLEELFRTGGQVPDTKYIFMGDFVDRGYYSLETFTRLMTLKARYPDRITLLRGNHETRQITQVYGFYDECLNKYGNSNAWIDCCKVFDLLTIAALIDESILCVHGGLSPELNTLDQIRYIERNKEIPHKGAFCDLVWSDPEDNLDKWKLSPRGAGYLFGKVITKNFMAINNLSLICRAHQLVDEGFRYMFDSSLVTVWSAPNYCYRCGNVASILEINGSQQNPQIFNAVPDTDRVIPSKFTTPYFL